MKSRYGVLFAMSAFALWAQAPTAEIIGTVTDATGAVVTAAKVTLSNPATNTQRVVTTNEAGLYNLPALPPGVYNLRLEMQGFQTQARSGVELQIGQVARLDFNPNVGNVAEVIEVQGSTPVLQTE